ncbi:small lysine-rich protein 1 [Macrotis lagotis]|uniref:small lysine-rich protein 1 n=1 Tax=Macrotis lagotis TaxID=92651 RepID=UPI003D680DD4
MPGKGKKGKGRAKGQAGKKAKKTEVDILHPATMQNLYYIAHHVADCLHLRGFRWPGAGKKKKEKKA